MRLLIHFTLRQSRWMCVLAENEPSQADSIRVNVELMGTQGVCSGALIATRCSIFPSILTLSLTSRTILCAASLWPPERRAERREWVAV